MNRRRLDADADGCDHNPYGFTIWMAVGGVKGGKVIGETGELGLRAVEDPFTSTTCTQPFPALSAWITPS